jgi:hypothetical protein
MDLPTLMQNTLSTDNTLRKQGKINLTLAEDTINNLVLDINLLQTLFQYLNTNDRLELKQSAALFLKSYITNYWVR